MAQGSIEILIGQLTTDEAFREAFLANGSLVFGIALARLGMRSWLGRDDSLTASGTLEARNINVGSKVGGRVARVNVLEGDHIQTGQVLLTFEDSELNGRLVSAQGKYEEAKANYDNVRREGACVLASVGIGPRTLYFSGHYDVVPAQSCDQFQPGVEGANLSGRGSSDMKSGLAAMIHAAAAARDDGLLNNSRIGIVLVPDEETAGPRGSRDLDARGLLGRDAFGMLTPEAVSSGTPTAGPFRCAPPFVGRWHTSAGNSKV